MNQNAYTAPAVFLSGPFTGRCDYVRTIVRHQFPKAGIHVVEKRNDQGPSVMELMESCRSVLFVYGCLNPAIQDVAGRSLVARELQFAAERGFQAGALLLAEGETPAEGEMVQLRKHVQNTLGPKAVVLDLPDAPLRKETDAAWGLALDTVTAHMDGKPISGFFSDQLPPETRTALSDPATAATLLAGMSRLPEGPPGLSHLKRIFLTVHELAVEWKQRTARIVSDQVFFSYASEDSAIVERAERALEKEGFAIWRDQRRMQGGDPIQSHLDRAIHSSGAVLVFVSANSARSKWVDWEVETSLQHQEQMNYRGFVIPIRLGGHDSAGLFPKLAETLALDLRDGEGFSSDISSIAQHLRKRKIWLSRS